MSHLDKFVSGAKGVTGYQRLLGRANRLARPAELLGSQALARVGVEDKSQIEFGALSAVGLAAGGIIGAKHGHLVIGAISGTSLLTNAPHLLDSDNRPEALWNLAQTQGACLAAMSAKNEPAKRRALLFVLGWLGVGALRYIYGKGR